MSRPGRRRHTVPVGLCHTAVDGIRVDTDANPRLLDVAPTIVGIMRDAGLGIDGGIGETHGVDLRAHDGPLTGVCRQSYASPLREPDETVKAVVRSDGLDLRPAE